MKLLSPQLVYNLYTGTRRNLRNTELTWKWGIGDSEENHYTINSQVFWNLSCGYKGLTIWFEQSWVYHYTQSYAGRGHQWPETSTIYAEGVISEVNCYCLDVKSGACVVTIGEHTSSTDWTVLQNTRTGGASVLLRVSSSCFWVKIKWSPEYL